MSGDDRRRRPLTPRERAIVEWFRLQLQRARERDNAEFELDLLPAQLESARRQADFLQEQATEWELELAEWRRLNIDLRKDRKALTEARREALE
jgi:hypothetical protein